MSMNTKAAAENVAAMVTEWVEGGIKGGTDWRNGLAGIIEKRLNRFVDTHARPKLSADKIAMILSEEIAVGHLAVKLAEMGERGELAPV